MRASAADNRMCDRGGMLGEQGFVRARGVRSLGGRASPRARSRNIHRARRILVEDIVEQADGKKAEQILALDSSNQQRWRGGC